jgi:hypothetical protein
MKSFVLRNVPAIVAALVVMLAGGAFAVAHSSDSKPKRSSKSGDSHHGGGHDHGHGHHGHDHDDHGKRGPRGRRGPEGPPGPEGPAGKSAPVGLSTWGKMPRNEYGSPIAETGSTATGVDALILQTGCFKEPCTSAASWEKAEYGSEIEFAGLKIADIVEIGLSVYIADSTAGASPMPNIQMEVNPKVGGKTYSSLVYNPGETAPNVFEWVDATVVPADPGNEGWWFSNGAVAAETGCTLSSACSLAEVQAAAPEAEVSLSLGLGKGRDTHGQVLISEFKLNGTTYTFGPGGTFKE